MRASGKTFRELLEAIIKVSKGNDVIFVCESFNMRNWVTQKCGRILSSYLTPNFYSYDGTKNSFYFNNGHYLTFKYVNKEESIQDALRGYHPGYLLMRDPQ